MKIHFQNSKTDGSTLLQRSRLFILILDENVARRGKVCKSYDALALYKLLLVKIVSKELKENIWFKVFKNSIKEGFKRRHQYEITNVQKKKEFNVA